MYVVCAGQLRLVHVPCSLSTEDNYSVNINVHVQL